jgi:hypothetical protein
MGAGGLGEHTGADTGAEAQDLLVDGVTASLLRAILEAVGEVGLAAVAGDVVGSAAQLGGGNGDHVVDAKFLCETLVTTV